jgi:tRNA (guanine37-N1)-methyltransferase
MPLSVDILTIFPDIFSGFLGESIVDRALRAGLVTVRFTNLRDFTHDRHRSVDDRPYGGGPGMVFKPEPVFEAVEHLFAAPQAPPESTRKLILTPRGRVLGQPALRSLAEVDWLVLLCGHYEGFDERIYEGLCGQHGFEELSIGDYVLSGGEVAAMVVLDGVIRLLPGALGDPESATHESFESGLLDFPQYTRPAEYRGMRVPEVLLSGNHAEIARWRMEQALLTTSERRADLLFTHGQGQEGSAAGSGSATKHK